MLSCFGIAIHESVVKFLSMTPQFSHIRDRLEELQWESFIVQAGGDAPSWKFSHDKCRVSINMVHSDTQDLVHTNKIVLFFYQEAAYSLIAKQDKDEVGHKIEDWEVLVDRRASLSWLSSYIYHLQGSTFAFLTC